MSEFLLKFFYLMLYNMRKLIFRVCLIIHLMISMTEKFDVKIGKFHFFKFY